MSYVEMAEHICVICGKKHTHNTEVLVHKRMGDIKEDERVTGYGLCKKHDELYQQGMTCLIEISDVDDEDDGSYNIADVSPTGRVVHVDTESFNMSPDEPVAFVSIATFDYIVDLYNQQHPSQSVH